MKMTRVGGRKLELVCVLCNESLADLERACAGELGKSRKLDNNNNPAADGRGFDSASVLSEYNSCPGSDAGGGAVGGPAVNPPPQYGGYVPLTDHNHKQVVATKCGHMFHQGCLRKHVHKTLIEGKGGSLFCPMCTRPFAMNRLWPVIIPPTKHQRERYVQLQIMKDQNAEMVKQLKEIRSKIAEEEEHLKRIKEDSEQCLHDIQQKQKLLDSVSGPTNKEMAELTKVHMKRQEILHVVTQHNADLLKLLAEESNITTATAENMLSVNINSRKGHPSELLPTPGGSVAHDKHSHHVDSDEEIPLRSAESSKKCSRKTKKDKNKKKSKRKGRKRDSHHQSSSPGKSRIYKRIDDEIDSENMRYERDESTYPPIPAPSEIIPLHKDNNVNSHRDHHSEKKHQSFKAQCKKVDTFTKWRMESMKELMCLPGLSDMNSSNPSTSTIGGQDEKYMNKNTSQKQSVNIALSRKPNMLETDGLGAISKK